MTKVVAWADEAQTETGITTVIQTTEKEFEDIYERG